MSLKKKILCSICARGNSKGIPNKNLYLINKTPLIALTISQAKNSGIFLYIAVSSDSEAILNEAQKYQVDYLIKRPNEMATDSAAKLPAIRHCAVEVEKLSGVSFDIFVDLDVTAPLRTPEDIRNAVQLLEEKSADNIITGCKARRSPYFNLVEEKQDGRISLSKVLENPIVCRQDVPKSYDMNASIYVWNRKTLLTEHSLFNKNTYLYEMPEERSIDIDSHFDLEIVKYLIEKKSQPYV